MFILTAAHPEDQLQVLEPAFLKCQSWMSLELVPDYYFVIGYAYILRYADDTTLMQ